MKRFWPEQQTPWAKAFDVVFPSWHHSGMTGHLAFVFGQLGLKPFSSGWQEQLMMYPFAGPFGLQTADRDNGGGTKQEQSRRIQLN